MSVETNLIARLFRENFQKQRKLYFIAIFAMILVAVTTALSAYVMGEIVNGMMVSRDLSRVYQIAVFILAIFLVKGFATYFQSLYMAKAGNRIIAEQQSRLFSFVLSQDAAFFQKYASSDFLTRITYNSQSVRQVIDIIVSSFVRDLFTLIGLVGVMIIQQPYLSIGSLTIGPIAFLGLRLLLKKVRHYMSLELLSITAMIHVVQETSLGIRIVKAFNLEDMLKARMNKTVLDIERQANRLARMEAATAPIMETLAGIAIAGMLALSGVLVLKYGQSPGELMSFITALLLAYEPAKRLARMRVTIEGGMVGVKGMFAMLDHPVTLVEKWDAKILAVKKGDIRV